MAIGPHTLTNLNIDFLGVKVSYVQILTFINATTFVGDHDSYRTELTASAFRRAQMSARNSVFRKIV